MRAYITTLFAFLLLPTLGFAAGGTWATISTVLVVINALLWLAGACAPDYMVKTWVSQPQSPHFLREDRTDLDRPDRHAHPDLLQRAPHGRRAVADLLGAVHRAHRELHPPLTDPHVQTAAFGRLFHVRCESMLDISV